MRSTLLALLFSLPCTLLAQSTNVPVIQRDPVAITTVQNAVNALGGSAVTSANGCVATANVHPDPSLNSSPWTATFKTQGSEFRNESVRDGKTTISVSGSGRPQVNDGSKTTRLPSHVLLSLFPQHLPALVLSQRLADSRWSIGSGGPTTVSGRPALMVTVKDETDPEGAALTAQVWSFDAVSGLPLRVDYVIPQPRNATSVLNAAIEFGDYRKISGMLIPFQFTEYIEGNKQLITSLSAAECGLSIGPSEFRLAGGGQ